MRSDLDENHPWHPSQVNSATLGALHAAITQAAEQLWKRDEDGDLPVNWAVTDRTRNQPHHYGSVPYSHHAETEDDHNEILLALVHNLSTASAELESYMRMRESAVRDGLARDKRLTQSVAQVMARAIPVQVAPKKLMAAATTVLTWLQQRRFNWT